mgnify:CR=1 FL=1
MTIATDELSTALSGYVKTFSSISSGRSAGAVTATGVKSLIQLYLLIDTDYKYPVAKVKSKSDGSFKITVKDVKEFLLDTILLESFDTHVAADTVHKVNYMVALPQLQEAADRLAGRRLRSARSPYDLPVEELPRGQHRAGESGDLEAAPQPPDLDGDSLLAAELVIPEQLAKSVRLALALAIHRTLELARDS